MQNWFMDPANKTIDDDVKIPKIKHVFKHDKDLTKEEKDYIDKRIFKSDSQEKVLIETIVIKNKKDKSNKLNIERIWNEADPLKFIIDSGDGNTLITVKDDDEISKFTTKCIFEVLDKNNLDINDVEICLISDVITKYR